jgi:Flp pilus assembly protein TadG
MKIFGSNLQKPRHKGQATLELALVLPVFMTLILGIFEISRIFFYNVSVANASREAVRYASTSGTCKTSEGCKGTDGKEYYRDCTGIQNTAISKSPGIGVKAADVTISYDTGPDGSGNPVAYKDGSNNPYTCANVPSMTQGYRIVVTVTKNFKLIIPIPGLKNFNITSTSYRTYIGQVQ